MRAEIVTVGTEILLGEILNTNARFLSRECAGLGVDVYHHITVGDNAARLREALLVSRERSDLLIVTGGIGPTPDDITRHVVAEAWDRELKLDEALLERMERFYAQRSLAMHANSRRQALIPEGAVPLPNDVGTAAGFFLQDARGSVACLPGPPAEMETMFSDVLLPILRQRDMLPESSLFSHDILTAGIGEASVATRIGRLLREQSDPTIATYAAEGTVRVRLTTRAESQEEAEEKFAPIVEEISELLGSAVYGHNGDSLAGVVGDMLRSRGLTLALAESCTGGMLGGIITDVPGSSDFFLGGIVCYSNAVKTSTLGVPEQLLVAHGAVSEEVAASMAEGAMEVLGSDAAVAITGIAGPSGGTQEKPVGTVVFAIAGPWGLTTERRRLSGSRDTVRRRSAVYALMRIREHLLECGDNP